MSIKDFLSFLSGVLLLCAFYPYIKSIVCRGTSPRKVTWLIWSLGDIIILAGMIAKGTLSGLMVGAVIGATATFILSLKFGESGWKRRDKACLTLASLAIILWITFGDSNVGIALSCAALAIAAWPTYASAWEKPENEDRKAWVVFVASSFISVLAIPHLTFADTIPPTMFFLIDAPMIYLTWVRPCRKKRVVEVEK